MRRNDVLADKLLSSGNCPAEALVRLANQAEIEGDRAQAIHAWKAVLPYVYAKPKPIESEPERALELAEHLLRIRNHLKEDAADQGYRAQLIANMAGQIEKK
ncbi:hypothetical protein WG622_11415 [Cognatishimia sp. D5M38]|uniref:Uncharacterized protein n=1 Tax=Cognatishimia coralii TaxID=3083254 RepID=A0ABU8QHF7_9RHOB